VLATCPDSERVFAYRALRIGRAIRPRCPASTIRPMCDEMRRASAHWPTWGNGAPSGRRPSPCQNLPTPGCTGVGSPSDHPISVRALAYSSQGTCGTTSRSSTRVWRVIGLKRLNAAPAGRYAHRARAGKRRQATVYLANDVKHQRNVAVRCSVLTGLGPGRARPVSARDRDRRQA